MDEVLLKRVKLLKLGRYEAEHIGFVSLVVWVVLYPHSDDAISILRTVCPSNCLAGQLGFGNGIIRQAEVMEYPWFIEVGESP